MNTPSPRTTKVLYLLLGSLITALFPSFLVAFDCSSANITRNSQTAVENFQSAYGGGGTCDTVTGTLDIGGNNVVDLSPLSALTNLDGLSALTSVWKDVRVNDNHSLADCTGLITLLDPVDDGLPGPGLSSTGIPDVFYNVDLSGNLPGCNSVTEILADAPLMKINAGLNDVWYNPETPGQGFVFIVFPEIEQIFLAWFTYDTDRPPEDVTAMQV